TYALHVPTNFQKNTSALIIVLHGSGGSGLGIEGSSGFSALADQDGFAVAYPDGLVEPGEGVPDWSYFFNDFSDDVGFIRALIGELQADIAPDSKQVFVSGFSAGAFMAHRLGVQASDLIAGVGAVEGAISSGAGSQSVPSALSPVSVVILHGDQDHTVFYCGSTTDASQEETFNYWAGSSGNSCSNLDTQTPLCDSQGNITSLVEKTATSCSAGTEVKFYKLIGGTHAWNTGPMNVPNRVPYNPDLDSSTGITTRDILWDFFSTHPKP
ncbi:MAG: alpha/beta hydrolase family esterase, partial [Candidatus Sulfotelmatobacter sp.]